MNATEGNGGAPVRLSKTPIPSPDIPRGSMFPRCRPLPGADRLTFEVAVPGAVLTYHDVQVISDGSHTAVQVFVAPHDVVTWEPRL